MIGLHSFSGSDVIEKFSGKGKQTWTKAFLKADDKIIEVFASFPHDLTADTESELERFVCDVYVPNKNISKVKEARWIKFKTNSSNISSLPPTQGALHQHHLRSHWQAKLWINALESHPSNLDPKNYGWYQCEDEYHRLMTENPIAPYNILKLVSCSCKKSRCSPSFRGGVSCGCCIQGETCTALCRCEDCENTDIYIEQADEDIDEDIDLYEDN